MMPLALLQLCDSLFPIGGFAHSDGLEAAVTEGRVTSGLELRTWIDAVLSESLRRVDGPAVLLAWRAMTDGRREDLRSLDEEMHALRPSSTARAASRAMGGRLLVTWREIHPEQMLQIEQGARLTLPVAFGVVCAASQVESRQAVEAFIYTRLSATVSSAMRLMPIGQIEAHALLARTLARVPGVRADIESGVVRGERPGAFAPAFDLATMGQQYVGSRLFLS
jgi:urease accessory protein